MHSALPDEIVKEILTPALRVTDERFRSIDPVSPFLTSTESSSVLLLVCKSWLRVATPLLYHVVVLRSKPQARALWRTLRGNQDFAAFIKKLRVEGGFGASMHHILRLGKNIEELWLKLDIWSGDSVTGLCSGLHLTNPRRLILPDESANENASTRKLVQTLCECIAKWERLSAVDLPFHSIQLWRPLIQSNILVALPKAKFLKTITLKEPQLDRSFLLSLARNPSLEIIHILTGNNSGSNRAFNSSIPARAKEILSDEKLGKLVHYEAMDLDDVMDGITDEPMSNGEASLSKEDSITISPTFVALQSAAEETDTAAASAFTSKKRCFQPRFSSQNNLDLEFVVKIPRINILLVSKLFFNTAMRHYFRYCLLDGLRNLALISRLLSRNPLLGSAIHHLVTYACWGGNPNHLHPFLVNATNLVHLTSAHEGAELLNYQSLVTLAATTGSKLQTLTGYVISRASTPKHATPLYAFTALRVLDWDSSIRLKFKQEHVPVDALRCLESLTCKSSNDTFLSLLWCMTLPALRHVTFPIAKKMEGALEFLKKHGKKLDSLSMEDARGCWALCPSLSVITISGLPVLEYHTSVSTIILTMSGIREGTIGDKFRALGTTDFGHDFPALDEIQVFSCQWPTTEPEIHRGPRSRWVKWSERLLEWNVKLTDKDGKHWKPRLK